VGRLRKRQELLRNQDTSRDPCGGTVTTPVACPVLPGGDSIRGKQNSRESVNPDLVGLVEILSGR